MKHAFIRVAATGCALTLFAAAALAQASDTTVTVPWGDTLAQIMTGLQETITVILLGVLTAAVAKLPGWVQAILNTWRVNQMLEKAIDYGINTTIGAVKGQELSVDVGNAVVKTAVEYVVTHAPGWLITWMGGDEMIRQKLMARVNIGTGALPA